MFLDRTRQLIVTLLDMHVILVHVPLAYGGRTTVQPMRGRNIHCAGLHAGTACAALGHR